jgi:hypothetical protein
LAVLIISILMLLLRHERLSFSEAPHSPAWLMVMLLVLFTVTNASAYFGLHRNNQMAMLENSNARLRPSDNNHFVLKGALQMGSLAEVKILESKNPNIKPGSHMPLLLLRDLASLRPERGFVYESGGKVVEVPNPRDLFRPLKRSFLAGLFQLKPYTPSSDPKISEIIPPGMSKKEWQSYAAEIVAQKTGIKIPRPPSKEKKPVLVERQAGVEKFAAADTVRNSSDTSAGEMYVVKPGGKLSRKDAVCPPHDGSNHGGMSASWVFHDPLAPVLNKDGKPMGAMEQFSTNKAGVHLWVKAHHGNPKDFRGAIYYRYDGESPKGNRGVPDSGTMAIPLIHNHTSRPEIGYNPDSWWTAPPLSAPKGRQTLSYRVSVWKEEKHK